MKDILKDIANIAGEHCDVGFHIDALEFTVWFTRNRLLGEERYSTIPITYSALLEVGHIDLPKYFAVNTYSTGFEPNVLECGFDWFEIEIINKILLYMRENEKEISEWMAGLRGDKV